MCDTHTRSEKNSSEENFEEISLYPDLMVRYDNQSGGLYKTVWVCKYCSTCILTVNAARSHLISCCKIELPAKPSPKPIVKPETTTNQHIMEYSSDKSDEEDEKQYYYSNDDILKIIS